MVLLIFLNGLYSARGNKEKWDFVQRRISYHHWIMCFDEQLLELAVVRPMGWHGEPKGISGGHITINFLMMGGVFVTTEHVYCNDAAYEARVGGASSTGKENKAISSSDDALQDGKGLTITIQQAFDHNQGQDYV
ncbi:hypothetical protein DFH94DRAFT_685310 [Russula ochroleuca]|uniref:Uncharacterized protein n=1 Tax=Russula ochroleuca TaxID=152965 RepID=A0A9P5JXN0_9AGAM|nr:hypothetical protein DFH94DRAFT_685310 [Russula ochroleuca]